MLLERSCLAWPAGDGEREWMVRQRGSTRLFLVRDADDEEALGAALGDKMAQTAWPVVRAAPVPEPEQWPAAEVAGDTALSEALRELLGLRPGPAAPVVTIAAGRLFEPATLERQVTADGAVLPVFELDHHLVVGPLLTATVCPCVRCLYGRLYANTLHPTAFRTLLRAVATTAGASRVIGAEAAAVVTAEERSSLARSVLACAADILAAAVTAIERPVFTLDLATGHWRRRDFAPLPGHPNDHAWKEAGSC
ncbi:hypothetical protein [Actinoplanes sp. NPDC051411]|uniref:hypothetical protein n=1 Tax=Actinoplanes sp. NPDC051411 TaxID=3155522 RepID=UPI00341CBD28